MLRGVLLSDAGRDFLHSGSMAHGMHPLSSTIAHNVEATSPTTYLCLKPPNLIPFHADTTAVL